MRKSAKRFAFTLLHHCVYFMVISCLWSGTLIIFCYAPLKIAFYGWFSLWKRTCLWALHYIAVVRLVVLVEMRRRLGIRQVRRNWVVGEKERCFCFTKKIWNGQKLWELFFRNPCDLTLVSGTFKGNSLVHLITFQIQLARKAHAGPNRFGAEFHLINRRCAGTAPAYTSVCV